jgi:hypothetical protein
MFCKLCADNNTSCPACKTSFNKKNENIVISIGADFMSTLHKLESVLKEKPGGEATPGKPLIKPANSTPAKGVQPKFAFPSPAVSYIKN